VVVLLLAVGGFLARDSIMGLLGGSAEDRTAGGAEPAATALPDQEPGDEPETSPTAVPQGKTAVPTAAPRPQPTRSPSTAASGARASRVDDISWRVEGDAVLISVRGDGLLSEGTVAVIPMTDPARILIRVRRIVEQYPRYQIDVDTALVTQIRTGYHPEQTPPALYIVLDIADEGVQVLGTRIEGNTATVALGR
jgi:hypothetical protein